MAAQKWIGEFTIGLCKKILSNFCLCAGCSLSDQLILSPMNPMMTYYLWRFVQIVLKFKTKVLSVLIFRSICVNLETWLSYYRLIGKKIRWSDKEQPVLEVKLFIHLCNWVEKILKIFFSFLLLKCGWSFTIGWRKNNLVKLPLRASIQFLYFDLHSCQVIG